MSRVNSNAKAVAATATAYPRTTLARTGFADDNISFALPSGRLELLRLWYAAPSNVHADDVAHESASLRRASFQLATKTPQSDNNSPPCSSLIDFFMVLEALKFISLFPDPNGMMLALS